MSYSVKVYSHCFLFPSARFIPYCNKTIDNNCKKHWHYVLQWKGLIKCAFIWTLKLKTSSNPLCKPVKHMLSSLHCRKAASTPEDYAKLFGKLEMSMNIFSTLQMTSFYTSVFAMVINEPRQQEVSLYYLRFLCGWFDVLLLEAFLKKSQIFYVRNISLTVLCVFLSGTFIYGAEGKQLAVLEELTMTVYINEYTLSISANLYLLNDAFK